MKDLYEHLIKQHITSNIRDIDPDDVLSADSEVIYNNVKIYLDSNDDVKIWRQLSDEWKHYLKLELAKFIDNVNVNKKRIFLIEIYFTGPSMICCLSTNESRIYNWLHFKVSNLSKFDTNSVKIFLTYDETKTAFGHRYKRIDNYNDIITYFKEL